MRAAAILRELISSQTSIVRSEIQAWFENVNRRRIVVEKLPVAYIAGHDPDLVGWNWEK